MSTTESDINVYRERAHLIAFFAAQHPSVIVEGGDPNEPDWPVIYIDTACGQLSWHLNKNDLDLFSHVLKIEVSEKAPIWDGHTTVEKYMRLAKLTNMYSFLSDS